MTRRRGSELDRVALLRARFAPRRGAEGVSVGIGDDAAVIDAGGGALVWTVDAQVEGTHFRLGWASWEDVGWRSFMAAASDLAAMGSAPLAALSALVLSDSVDDDDLDALARGQALAAEEIGAHVVGGNLARGTETSVTTTLLGRAERPVLRDGAREGDRVLVAGSLGHAAAGLAALARDLRDPCLASCVSAWRRPRARVREGLAMAPRATSAIDVSDGLARDLSHVADASDVRVVLDEARLREHAGDALAAAAAAVGRDVLDLVLRGGEDYALVVTSPASVEGFAEIGVVEQGAPGVVLRRDGGVVEPITARGFDHFA